MRRNEKGFTLIELIVVIAIIGILAAIVIPQFTNATTKAKESVTKSMATAVVSAANQKYAESLLSDIAGGADASTYPEADATFETNFSSFDASTWTITATAADGDVEKYVSFTLADDTDYVVYYIASTDKDAFMVTYSLNGENAAKAGGTGTLATSATGIDADSHGD